MTTSPWTFRTVADAADLEPRPPEISPAEAQEWANFIVFAPSRLPADCEVVAVTIRREAPPGRIEGVDAGRTPWARINPVAVRIEIAGPTRRLRLKQFLYDWAFPALDHPCLWDNPTVAHPLPGGDIVWHGVDYMKRQGASARLGRTLIETSVISGEFSRDDLDELYRGLAPVSPEAERRIAATGFARLRYWARHPDGDAPSVPTGLWRHDRRDEPSAGVWHDDTAVLRAQLGLPAALAGYEVEAAGVFGDGDRREVDVMYTARPHRDRELRLTVQKRGNGRLAVPARASSHPGERTEVTIGGTRVWLAWIDERYGPFDAVWTDAVGGTDRRLLSSTGLGMDREFFEGAVVELLS